MNIDINVHIKVKHWLWYIENTKDEIKKWNINFFDSEIYSHFALFLMKTINIYLFLFNSPKRSKTNTIFLYNVQYTIYNKNWYIKFLCFLRVFLFFVKNSIRRFHILIKFYFILFYFILFYFILFYFILLYFTLFYFLHW